jgi:hypothetical protein
MAHYLRQFAKRQNLCLIIHEVDIQRSRKHDLAKLSQQQFWLEKIKSGFYQILLTSPPCSTFTRAVWSNFNGPRPLRSALHPRGFKWLSFVKKKLAELGNILADFSFEAMRTMLIQPEAIAVMEQPEDLGANKSGPWPGVRPASMWQFAQFNELLKLPNVRTAAFYQADFGTTYAKPTRLLFRLNCELPKYLYCGVPTFDEQGFYKGPLPTLKRKLESLQRKSHDTAFKTTGTAAWPPKLCEWLAKTCLDSLVITDNGASEPAHKRSKCLEGPSQSSPQPEPVHSFPPVHPALLPPVHPALMEDQHFSPGWGEPRMCSTLLKTSLFHDGAGLLSPGRWDVERRNYPDHAFDDLREGLHSYINNYFGGEESWTKACLKLAVAKADIFDEEFTNKMRLYLANWCISNKFGIHGTAEALLQIDPGQPFLLILLKTILEAAGDGDHAFLEQARHGLPVGVLHQLPRTPLMYEEQTAWRLEDDPSQQPLPLVENYVSAELHADYVYKFFEEEIKEGLMGKMDEEEFFAKYGEHTAVAALAVLVEKNEKKRIIHDATHGVRVNHRIKCRDKQRMPGPKEKFYLLEQYREKRDVVFSVLADVSKAHRRFKHNPEEWGYISCKVKSTDKVIYYNRVGTFGVASASYWWSRIFAAVVRAVHYLLGRELPVDLLVYADDIECLGIGKSGRRGIVLAFLIMKIFATPFKWEKTRGGLQTDWIGLHTDYRRYMLGLSVARAKWLADWCKEVAKRQLVMPRVFASGLGRLCFSANALVWERPFLGPLFAWSAAIGQLNREVKVPWAICFILLYLANRFEKGDRLMPPPRTRSEMGVVFKTDARADEDGAWVGGWEPHPSGDTRRSRWFAVKVTEDWASWAFVKKNPQRVIAALELLGTLLGVILFSDRWQKGSKGCMIGQAITDNKGNSFIVAKQMSTKYPITLLLMELTEWLRELDVALDLKWVPRDQNTEADALSNMDLKDFNEELRMQISPKEIQWKILDELLISSAELYGLIVEAKQNKQVSPPTHKRTRKVKLLDDW